MSVITFTTPHQPFHSIGKNKCGDGEDLLGCWTDPSLPHTLPIIICYSLYFLFVLLLQKIFHGSWEILLQWERYFNIILVGITISAV